ncbi:ribokinase [Chromobacterium phragmitis]|uniref:Ribokinase n=1 Tax=Chromobacterium phragmitis TaxID=2202141 RepID=A0A344UEL4_9NEIS|nr:ribokinase [Chromobacterium phragmitis]AXE33712.1 ribokinase [Chromobacterium phragmitis]
MTRVLVVGSINMDLVVSSPRLPRLGETVMGSGFAIYPGGKGANQAVAASRLGAEVTMIGCLGNDEFGAQLRSNLEREGVDIRYVREASVSSGIATITVSDCDNATLMVPGANYHLRPEHLDEVEQAFADADVVLSQLETPLETVKHAAVLAGRHGKPMLLNPAPVIPLPEDLFSQITLLTPNEHEFLTMLAEPTGDWRKLLVQHPGKLVMSHGKHGAYYALSSGELRHEPGYVVDAVDSTGAGDTFNGALAAFLPLGLKEAVRRANAAGALSVMHHGAQSGMPTLDELEAFMGRPA